MTVIACNLKEMAGDSLCTSGEYSHYYTTKLYRMPDGSICGVAGNGGELLVDWLRKGADPDNRPSIEGSFHVLQLKEDGIYLYPNTHLPDKIRGDYFAIGCGAEVAMYAMSKGATPAAACAAASEVNLYCGGPIDVEKLQ